MSRRSKYLLLKPEACSRSWPSVPPLTPDDRVHERSTLVLTEAISIDKQAHLRGLGLWVPKTRCRS
jgi:hypothetical protein